MLNFLRDCSFIGPAFPDPFVQFELEAELAKAGLLQGTTGAEGRELQALWNLYRRKLRELISGGPRRVRNQVIEPILQRLGYAQISDVDEIRTREGPEDGGALLIATDRSKLRVWCTEYEEDLDAPTRRGAAYRFSHLQVARRVLKAQQERVGLLTNGVELRIIILDLARTDSEIIIRLDPAWKDRRATDPLDSFLLLLGLACPAGVRAIPELVDKARLQQARVTKELRRQAREAVEGFLQEVLNHPDNQEKLGDLAARHALAHELWREALIVVYRLLFVLKLEATDDPARSFKFSTSTLWRNTFSPTTALPRFVRRLLDEGTPSGNLIEQSVRKLFQMFVDGLECSELHVRPLGGSLFGPEATPLLSNVKWGERGVAWLLDRLLWTSPKRNSQGRERVHYGSLDVEDLGRVYEALLELAPGVATEDMCRLRRSKLEVVVPVAQGERYRATDTAHSELKEGDDEEAEDEAEAPEEESEEPVRGRGTKVEWIEHIPAGQFYLRVGLGRKASGSYYTPQSFVRFLVQQTLEPLVAARSPRENPRPAELLKIKVLDPAMGSGHFLVEACRFLGSKLYEATRLCDERLAQAMRTLEAAQNEEIRAKAVRDVADYGQRLAAFLPPDAKLSGYLPSRAPEAGESSGISQKQAEAICRRLVAIHCLYGVDKNPLGVELAKVALWLESHSEGFPLTFLDHRLVLGESITGPFFNHVLTYPGSKRPMNDLLTEGLREKFSAALTEAVALVKDIESTLCSTLPDFEARAKLREQMEAKLAPFKFVAAAWAGGVMLGNACDDDAYAELTRFVADASSLPRFFENERLREMISSGFGVEIDCRDSLLVLEAIKTGKYASALPFDLTFPEVFFRAADVSTRGGFDVVLGNPPWDTVTSKEKEWFSGFDFSVLDAATKVERESIQNRILSDKRIAEAFEKYLASFEHQKRMFDVLYRFQKVKVEGDLAGRFLDLFRVFMERSSQLLKRDGTTGLVVPSAFHANEGATGVRRLYLREMHLRLCYSFENRKQLFEIHRSFKFALIVADAGRPSDVISCAFYLHDDEWLFTERSDRPRLSYDLPFIEKTGGEYLAFPEIQQKVDADICRTCYENAPLAKDFCLRSGIVLAVELNKTKDARRFSPLPRAIDYRLPERHKHLLNEGQLILAEGKTFWQFDDIWGDPPLNSVPFARLEDRPDLLKAARYFRFGFRDISSATNERTAVFALHPPGVVFAHSVLAPERSPFARPTWKALFLVGVANTLVFDFLTRLRAGSHLSLFIFESLPLAQAPATFIAHASLRMTCNHSGYQDLWCEQLGDAWREEGSRNPTWPVFGNKEQRWRVRSAMDALVAKSYGLSRVQYEHVISTFNHTEYPDSPTLCLSLFDELENNSVETFTRMHDPYWDIPLNERLPEAEIDISIPSARENEGQHALAFTDVPTRPGHRAAVHVDTADEPYHKLCELIAGRQHIVTADVQEALSCSATQARTMLKRLVEDNVAVMEGRGRSTRYVAVSSAEARSAHPTGRAD
jgi:hypothetical protein